MIKSVTIIELAEGWTMERLGLPATFTLRAEGRPTLAVFRFPGTLLDCRIVVDDASGEVAAWVHGTDCSMTKAVRASMDKREAPFVPECARRVQGGAFRTISLPPLDKRH